MKNLKLLERLVDTDNDNRFHCSGAATLTQLAELEVEGFVKKYAGVADGGIYAFRITAAGARALSTAKRDKHRTARAQRHPMKF